MPLSIEIFVGDDGEITHRLEPGAKVEKMDG